MVALTHNETLSMVITDCWSPVMGNSRMSTFSILSTKGRSTRNPGWSTDLNWPKRLTTPTLPCWTILRLRDSNNDPDDFARRCQHGVLLTVRSVDDEQAALYVGHHHRGAHRDAAFGVKG